MNCDRHTDAAAAEFCFDCRVDVCGTCCGELHRRHRRQRLSQVTAECRRRVASELGRVTAALDATRVALLDVDRSRADILNQLQRKERFARKECCAEDDNEVQKRLRALSTEKDDALRQLAGCKELLEVEQMSLETFLEDGTRKLTTTTTTAGLLRLVKEVQMEASSLLRVHQKQLDKSEADEKDRILCRGRVTVKFYAFVCMPMHVQRCGMRMMRSVSCRLLCICSIRTQDQDHDTLYRGS